MPWASLMSDLVQRKTVLTRRAHDRALQITRLSCVWKTRSPTITRISFRDIFKDTKSMMLHGWNINYTCDINIPNFITHNLLVPIPHTFEPRRHNYEFQQQLYHTTCGYKRVPYGVRAAKPRPTFEFFFPMPPHVPYGLRGLPFACGRSVTDFWGWDAHEVQLRCPDELDGDIWIWRTRRGLKPKFYWTTQTMVTMEIFPFKEKSSW
jgi:hypothetical protein